MQPSGADPSCEQHTGGWFRLGRRERLPTDTTHESPKAFGKAAHDLPKRVYLQANAQTTRQRGAQQQEHRREVTEIRWRGRKKSDGAQAQRKADYGALTKFRACSFPWERLHFFFLHQLPSREERKSQQFNGDGGRKPQREPIASMLAQVGAAKLSYFSKWLKEQPSAEGNAGSKRNNGGAAPWREATRKKLQWELVRIKGSTAQLTPNTRQLFQLRGQTCHSYVIRIVQKEQY